MSTSVNSRAGLVRPAIRPAMPARLMLSGPAGSGKTWTALTIARILVGPDGTITLIDTETESALLYAEEHRFQHLPWEPPYNPRELAATIVDLGVGPDHAIVVDSLTHFWQGEGGTLDIADGKFGGWKEATPAQDEMVMALLRCPSHVIGCVREKQAYSVSETIDGGRKKQTVEKVGLQPQQREGLDYEFNVTASMDMHHNIVIAKTRCRVLADKSYRANHADEMADVYKTWLAGGQVMVTQDERHAFIERVMKLLPDVRKAFLAQFKEAFGSTDQMLAADLPEATKMLEGYESPELPLTGELADALAESQAAATATGAAWPEDQPAPEPEFDVDGDGQGPDVDAPKGRAKAWAK